MLNRAIFSPAAISGIDGIWNHSAETWGADQADRSTDGIRDAWEDLARGRKQGRAVGVRDGCLKRHASRPPLHRM